jgi:hypothetical protein
VKLEDRVSKSFEDIPKADFQLEFVCELAKTADMFKQIG